MISCRQCCGNASADHFSWSPEMIVSSFDLVIFGKPVYDHDERFSSPEVVYPDVPVRPPINL
jgi:hypothetical protein